MISTKLAQFMGTFSMKTENAIWYAKLDITNIACEMQSVRFSPVM